MESFLSTTMVRAELIKENIYKGNWGSCRIWNHPLPNANFKAPNNSTNTLYFSGGLSYQLKQESFPARISYGNWRSKFYSERIKYNAVFRTGVNEADVNGFGSVSLLYVLLFADKRINYKSTFQVGLMCSSQTSWSI